MPTFSDYRPKGGMRQPRVQYRVDDSRYDLLEELRAVYGPRNMNAAYLEALLIGAREMLRPAAPEAEKQGVSLGGGPGDRPTPAPAPQASPPAPSLLPSLPPPSGTRIVRSSSGSAAAAAQFERFGSL